MLLLVIFVLVSLSIFILFVRLDILLSDQLQTLANMDVLKVISEYGKS